MTKKNRYSQIIEEIFFSHYKEGAHQISFERKEIERVANKLGIKLPKNLGDLIYSFRYRQELPESVREKAPQGESWIILPAGRSRYYFATTALAFITPNKGLVETRVPDSTPGVIEMYSLSDEQSLLAKVRYNRLIDIFSSITCYSLQSHLRTTVSELGQVETDEIYIGIDKRGAHFIFPIQAKGGKDTLNIVQIVQDFALCESKFPSLVCRPVAAQFMEENLIALFAFEKSESNIAISSEKHYRLTPPEDLTPEELTSYKKRPD